MRAIADAYDRKEAEERGEELAECLESLKTKRAQKPRDPDAFNSNAVSPDEAEKLRQWYGLPKSETVEPNVEQKPASKQPRKPKKGTKRTKYASYAGKATKY